MYLYKNEHSISIFCDLRKAFDGVNHNTLLNKPTCYSVRGLPHAWIESYLENRIQPIRTDSQANKTRRPALLKPTKIKAGVP